MSMCRVPCSVFSSPSLFTRELPAQGTVSVGLDVTHDDRRSANGDY
jgi:hypothetical protein